MKSLFENSNLPVVLAHQIEAHTAEFKLEFIPELIAFNGHFPHHPIYPGVGQIAFVQKFAKDVWADLDWCSALEQIKFQDLIQPHAIVLLKLERKASKVSFQLLKVNQSLASGRLVFETVVKN
jgi:3-hydroxymyristoyl/3-hydroxydecanoyl-(acyl carrier protein) dehydratase